MITTLLLIPLFLIKSVISLSLDTSDTDSICSAASLIVEGTLNYLQDDHTFSGGAWWESAHAYGALLNYQHLCKNDTYEDTIYNGLLSQIGENSNYEPSSEKDYIGNDDIGAWALVAIQAAEQGFKSSDDISWAQLAKNSFSLLYSRWDDDTCNGGIRWQFDSDRSGYNFKNTITNANLFQLGARLARYYSSDDYLSKAESIYDWIYGVELINDLQYGSEVYDGFKVDSNCTDTEKVLWTYNYGTLIAGSAFVYDITKDDDWKDRIGNVITGSQILYNDTVLYERACELYDICNDDQTIFKAIYARFLGLTSKLVPSFEDQITGLITPSAKGAATSCSGGTDGHTCGQKWGYGRYDDRYGLGEQVSALEIILNLLVNDRDGPKKA